MQFSGGSQAKRSQTSLRDPAAGEEDVPASMHPYAQAYTSLRGRDVDERDELAAQMRGLGVGPSTSNTPMGYGHGHGHGGGHGSGPGPSPPSAHPTAAGALPGPPGASPQQQQQQRPWSPPAIQGGSPSPFTPPLPFLPSSPSFLQPFDQTLTANF